MIIYKDMNTFVSIWTMSLSNLLTINHRKRRVTDSQSTIGRLCSIFSMGFFEVTKELQKKADGTGYAQADRITMINGSSSLIKHMVIKSSGKIVYESDNLHRITNVKNLLEYSDDLVDPLERIRSGILILMEQQQILIQVSRPVVF